MFDVKNYNNSKTDRTSVNHNFNLNLVKNQNESNSWSGKLLKKLEK